MTFIDGIASSENIDTSGEIVDIKGLDITSLPVSGTLNWEHKNDLPSQTVGKILKAKKIFSAVDCSDAREAYYWNKCETPFVYIMGQLFDDYADSAKHVAGLFKYDSDNRAGNARNVLNFSVEGAKIPGAVDGMRITRSIARKVTITCTPANHAAIAELVPGKEFVNDDFNSIFKSESGFEIEMVKSEEILRILKKDATFSPMEILSMEKASAAVSTMGAAAVPKVPKETVPKMNEIGKTKTGKSVMDKEMIGNYKGFSSADHMDASQIHSDAARKSPDAKIKDFHTGKMKLHMQASQSAEKRESRKATTPVRATPKAETSVVRPYGQVENLGKSDMKKALTAGMPGAPGDNVQGAALQGKPVKKLMKSKKSEMKKSENIWLDRAKTAYSDWSKKEQFAEFMSKKMPQLTKSEIAAIGQTLALKKELDAEKRLAKLEKALTFGDGKPAAKVSPENDATPKPVPKEFRDHNKKVKGVEHTEIAHVQPHYDGKSPDTIYTKAGHKLEGHPKGKFKAGDKVTAKSFIMGTHTLEHGHND